MAKKKICVNCGRSIDEVARVCLYCNWLQSDPVPPRQPVATAPEYVPPPDTRARNKLIGIIGFAMLLLVAFIIDRKSTRLNSSHSQISYAVFCLKKKKTLSCG